MTSDPLAIFIQCKTLEVQAAGRVRRKEGARGKFEIYVLHRQTAMEILASSR